MKVAGAWRATDRLPREEGEGERARRTERAESPAGRNAATAGRRRSCLSDRPADGVGPVGAAAESEPVSREWSGTVMVTGRSPLFGRLVTPFTGG